MNASRRFAPGFLLAMALGLAACDNQPASQSAGPQPSTPQPPTENRPVAPTTQRPPSAAVEAQQSFDDFFASIHNRKRSLHGVEVGPSDFRLQSQQVAEDPLRTGQWMARVTLRSDFGPGAIVVVYQREPGGWKFNYQRSYFDGADEGESDPQPLPRGTSAEDPIGLGDIIEAAFKE